MSRKGKRKRVAEGVYEDATGLAATVKVHKRQIELRFEKGTSLEHIAAWRQSKRDALLEDLDEDAELLPAPGTFAEELAHYESRLEARVGFKSDRSHLRAWLPLIGSKPRRRVRSSHVTKAIRTWQRDGLSARSIRHRLRVLREMYRALDGRHAPTPVLGVKAPQLPAPHPVAVDWQNVREVAESLKRGKAVEKQHGPNKTTAVARYASPAQTYARLLVLATTGQRPAQVMRAEPADVDLKRLIWMVRPAKGGRAISLPLDAAMVRAWRAFIAADAWGPYDSRSFAKTLRRHGWPDGVRPYQLRHTLAIDLILGGADLVDVQAALGHRQIATTQTYYAPLLLARQRRALRLKRRARLA